MSWRHLANENDKKIFSALIKPYKKPNERFYLLNFFRVLINITKDDGRSLFITKPFIYQMAQLYFA